MMVPFVMYMISPGRVSGILKRSGGRSGRARRSQEPGTGIYVMTFVYD